MKPHNYRGPISPVKRPHHTEARLDHPRIPLPRQFSRWVVQQPDRLTQWVGSLTFLLSLTLAFLTCGCTSSATLKPDLHYVLGQPYQSATVWYYPKESFDLDQTGLAVVDKNESPRLTTDGELFDQTVLAAGHPTIQLPAIARLTNLENGREVTIRLNDRGSGDPHCLVEITRRTALLLGIPTNSIARVRLRVRPNESHDAADELPGAPSLRLAAAPRVSVEVAELAPAPGVRQGVAITSRAVAAAGPEITINAPPPLRLPETVTQTLPHPGRLMVQLDTFDQSRYAAVQRAKMAAAGARIVSVVDGRTVRFRVEIGPLPDVVQAYSILDQALASGIPDARIVVD